MTIAAMVFEGIEEDDVKADADQVEGDVGPAKAEVVTLPPPGAPTHHLPGSL